MSDQSTPPNPPDNPPPAAPPPPPAAPSPAAPPPPPASPPSASTGGATGNGGDSNRTIFLVLAYLGPFALIPFLMNKEDKEVLWHSKHGLVLFGAELMLHIGLVVVMFAGGSCGSGCVVPILQGVLVLATLVLHIFCIVKAINGERFLIPGLSDLADQF